MTSGEFTTQTRKIPWRLFAAGFVVWTVVGLSFALRTYFYNYRQGIEVWLVPIITSYLIDFYLWGLASPIIFHLSHQFPLVRKRLVSHSVFHLLSGVVFTFAIIALSVPLYWYLLGYPDTT